MRLSIVIPAYNEGYHLETVVRRLYDAVHIGEPSSEIIIVNNGSTDSTPRIATDLTASLHGVRVVDVYPNEGYGNGVLHGLKAASGDVLGWVHADDQASPQDLLNIFYRLNEAPYDLCKAVRIQRDESVWRLFQSVVYNSVFRLLFGVPFRDINGTPKLMTRSLYEKLNLGSRDWFLDPETVLKAHDAKARIGEVEILWRARNGGSSHVRLSTALQFIKHMIQYRFSKYRSRL
jgi:glycosyltransferase involved in cell wall biosynthesis